MAVDPSGKYAYVSDGEDDTVSMLRTRSTSGVLTPNTPATIATGSVPGLLAVDPSGKFAYVSSGTDNGAIFMYTIKSGILTPNTPPSIGTGAAPQLVVVAPSGKFVYVANGDSNEVSIYSLNGDGATDIIGRLATTGNSPVSIVLTGTPH